MARGDMCTITILEGEDGAILTQSKFDPPVEEWKAELDQLPPVAEAAAVAIGALSNYAAGLPHE